MSNNEPQTFRRDTIGPFDFVTRFYEADPKNSIQLRLINNEPLFWVMDGEVLKYQNIRSKRFEVEYIEDRNKFRIKFIEDPAYDIEKYEIEEPQMKKQ